MDDLTTPHPAFVRGLARAVACGKSVESWARRREIDVNTALKWTLLPEFQALVEEYRVKSGDGWWEKSSGVRRKPSTIEWN